MKIQFEPQGVCCRQMYLEISDDNKIKTFKYILDKLINNTPSLSTLKESDIKGVFIGLIMKKLKKRRYFL